MAAAALAIEYLFAALHLIPRERHAQVMEAAVSWNYTTWLNLIFLAMSLLMLIRFLRTGGPAMLKAMGEVPKHDAPPQHHCCHH
jgi:hypothetical protein